MWREDNRQKLRAKSIERHEANIALEKKSGVKKDYKAVKAYSSKGSMKFYEGDEQVKPEAPSEKSETAQDGEFRLSHISKHKVPKVSKAIDRLSQPKRRESPAPFDHADFKGLIHRDYIDAIQNLAQEPTSIQRSTMRLLQ